jgi:hypothetical protein
MTLGSAFYLPAVGDTSFSPLAAFYSKLVRDSFRLRLQLSVFDNEVDLAVPIYSPFEFVFGFENYTVPFGQTEVVDGSDDLGSEIVWGSLDGYLGVGLRFPVAPLEADSDLRFQLQYRSGWLYTRYTANTQNETLPPDTYVHGVRFRVRYDGLVRNLLELAHEGIAAGCDIDYTHRNLDRDYTVNDTVFPANETRDVMRIAAYLVAAFPIPGLSERSRLITYVHGGITPIGKVDRFDAFRVGGGPFPCETDDLYRHPYPGALFNQVPASEYVLATVEYRLELLFFVYWSLRGTMGWGNQPTLRAGHFDFRDITAYAASTGITCGAPWNSELYIEYAWDSGELRNGQQGSSILVTWSKAF